MSTEAGRYRKKPVLVEAFRYTGQDLKVPGIEQVYLHKGACVAVIKTRDGTMLALPGDWIVTAPEGRYPVRDDVFRETFEKVEN